jgi:formamidopyrimidine-DNA glycosylase
MPELPEVETIRRDLMPLLRGRAFTHVWVSPEAPRLVQAVPAGRPACRTGRQAPTAADFACLLPGRRIEDISRRGKFLVFHLSGGLYLIVHLRMTGALLLRRPSAPPDRYVRAVLSLDDGSELRFSDLRKFGALWLVPDPSPVLGRLGPEPLDGGLMPSLLREVTARRRAPIKSLLLDQRALAGLGNIYADEALFAAGLHPQRPASSLSDSEVERLHEAIGRVLTAALDDRGASFSDYVDASGREGRHQFRVQVFRRTGQPCYVCGREIARVKVAGRSSHFCPRCQPLEPGATRNDEEGAS